VVGCQGFWLLTLASSLEGVDGVVVLVVGGRHGGDHARAAVARQPVLQQPRELGVAIWHIVGASLGTRRGHLAQRVDAVGQR